MEIVNACELRKRDVKCVEIENVITQHYATNPLPNKLNELFIKF